MTGSDGSLTFKCSSCEHPLIINNDNPPDDGDVICCQRCGKEFGAYVKVKAAAFVLAMAVFDSVIENNFPDLPFMSVMELTAPKAD